MNPFLKKQTLNICGLTIGLTSSILILLFIKSEQSFDRFHKNYNHIYRIRSIDYKKNEKILDVILVPPPLGPAIISRCPEVESYVRFYTLTESIITINNQKFEDEKLSYVDSTFLQIFTVPLVSGNPLNCLNEPNTAIISETNAKKYFARENPVGKLFTLNNEFTFKITGVYKDIPFNSHFHFNIFMSYNTPHWLKKKHDHTWDMYFTRTYLLINENANIKQLEGKIDKITKDNKPSIYKDDTWTRALQPLGSIHLYSHQRGEFESNGNHVIVFILTVIAFLILIISWINYINISTAKSLNSAKKIGISKVLGYGKKQIIMDNLSESLLVNCVALFLSLILILLLITPVSDFLHVRLSFANWDWGFSLLLAFIFLTGAILSGLYPALVSSSFDPVDTLKGKIGLSTGRIGLRKALLIFQFATSIAIIMVTMVIYFQTHYMLNKDLGVDMKNTLVLKGNNIQGSASVYRSKFEMFKQKLLENSEIQVVTAANALPANTDFSDGTWSDIQRKEDYKELLVMYVDYNFIPALKIQMTNGRNFSKDFPTDQMGAIVTQSAAKKLGFNNSSEIINHKTFRVYGDSGKHVIGVVKDFRLASLRKEVIPQIIYLNPAERRFIIIKAHKVMNNQLISKVNTAWKGFFGDEMFRYFILEDSYNELYKKDIQNSILLAIFSFISIFTAMLGLLGLTYFTIKQRMKEIGIRKVIGSTVIEIIVLILFDFLKFILIASVFALPIGYYFASKWLESYADRIVIQWWYFVLPVLVVGFITVSTVSFYAIRSALANPVKVIRCE